MLWGVPWEYLLIASCVFFLALTSHWLAVLLISLLNVVISRTWSKEYGAIVGKTELRFWTNWIIKTGMFWLGYTLLFLPPNWTDVLDHIVPIPFMICLFFFANAVFNTLTDMVKFNFRKLEHMDEDAIRRNNTKSVGYCEALRVCKYIVFIILFLICFLIEQIDLISFLQNSTLLGLMLVFALQPWLRNVIGGLILFADEKFVMGDSIRVANLQGQVESIELRSTTIIRGDNSKCIIPNARIMEQPVANMSLKAFQLLRFNVFVREDTPPENLRNLLRDIQNLLLTLHPAIVSSENHQENTSNNNKRRVYDDNANGLEAADKSGLDDDAEGKQQKMNSDADLPQASSRIVDFNHESIVALTNPFEILVQVYIKHNRNQPDLNREGLGILRSEIMLAVSNAMIRCNVKARESGVSNNSNHQNTAKNINRYGQLESLTDTYADSDAVTMTTAYFMSDVVY